MSTSGITKGTNLTMNHPRTRRRPAPAIAVIITALLVAACGSSSSTSSSASSSSAAAAATGAGLARTKLAACLKQHGVTLPARPADARRRAPGAGANGGYGAGAPGVFGGGGAAGAGRAGAGGPFANNPKLRAAFQACGGGAFRARRTSFNHAAVTKFAACVNRHGYTLPAPNFSGKGPIFPARIASNKKFQAASRACASLLRPTRPAAGSRGGTSTGSSSGTKTT
jgi:hypothetical protein